MRLTPNTPPPPADPLDLAASFEEPVDDFAADLDTGELAPTGFADPAVDGVGADDRRSRSRRKPIEG